MPFYRRLLRWLGAENRMTHIVSGNVAPGFSLKSLDGKEFSLNAALERGPVVLSFFKVSCPVCKFTFPFLERLFKTYGGDGVRFLGVFGCNGEIPKAIEIEPVLADHLRPRVFGMGVFRGDFFGPPGFERALGRSPGKHNRLLQKQEN